MDDDAGKAPATNPERAEEYEHERLGGLLKRVRARIAPERVSLGPYLRVPMRVGKTVTQEEVAEAVGISRQWYALLERDRAMRVSAAVLGRIADVLMMDPEERTTLFKLAVPELRSEPLTDTSIAVLNAYGSFRYVTQRLWAATTEAEALTVASEYLMKELAPDLVVSSIRVGEGRWHHVTIGGDPDRSQRFLLLFAEKEGSVTVDDLHCYTFLANPGDLITRAERDHRLPALGAKVARVLAAMEWDGLPSTNTFTYAHVRTQGGVARLRPIYSSAHAFSEIERAQLSALANLTSFALSGCVSPRER